MTLSSRHVPGEGNTRSKPIERGEVSFGPSRPISRVLFPSRLRGSGWRSSIWDDGYPSSLAAYPGLERDGSSRVLDIDRELALIAWPCSWWGLPGRPCHHGRRWSLTPPFHHHRSDSSCQLLTGEIATAVCFSVALFRQVSPTWDYPAPHPLEPGLSSPPGWGATAWPTWATVIMITRYPSLSRRRVLTLRATGLTR
jgi:hypothetical protein